MTGYDGLSPVELAARLRSPGCVVLDRVTSTMDVAHELARDGAPGRTLVVADSQVQGRGRRGAGWCSEPGRGIWVSFIHRPRQEAGTGVLSLRVGLAIHGALAELGVSSQPKWPNDIIIGERKVCGILCEGRWQGNKVGWIIVGVGMNVHGPVPEQVRDGAIALDEVAPGLARVPVLAGIVRRLHHLPESSTLTEDERRQFMDADWLNGREILEPAAGRVEGIDLDGGLLVRTAAGVSRCVGGHVVLA